MIKRVCLTPPWTASHPHPHLPLTHRKKIKARRVVPTRALRRKTNETKGGIYHQYLIYYHSYHQSHYIISSHHITSPSMHPYYLHPYSLPFLSLTTSKPTASTTHHHYHYHYHHYQCKRRYRRLITTTKTSQKRPSTTFLQSFRETWREKSRQRRRG